MPGERNDPLRGVNPSSGEELSLVSTISLEALLASVAQNPGDAQAGVFGPGSITWRINRESALFLGAGRAALLQLAHPWVAAALAQHSSLLSDPIARFHNTFRVVFTMVFGTRGQALSASRRLHLLHTRIRGDLPQDVARYERGSHYEANEVGALLWVFATLVESALIAYECVSSPLTASERNKYYAESKKMAMLFGIPMATLPKDWAAFTAYCKGMVESDALGVNDLSRSMARALLAGAGSWIRPPLWYRALTTFWMPTGLREEFALELNPVAQRSAERALRWLPCLYQRLPPFLRFVGPYQEANSRLLNRPISATIRMSNRFWIGEPQLPVAE